MNTVHQLEITNRKKEVVACTSVDKDVYEKLKNCRFSLKKGYVYFRCNKKIVALHRYVLGHPEGKIVDHINHDPLDNRRENLRECTMLQNRQNTKKSGFFHLEKNGKFVCMIGHNKKTHNLGTFESEEKAKEAIDIFIVENKLEFKVLHFPEKLSFYKTEIEKRSDAPKKLPKKFKSSYRGVSCRGDTFTAQIIVNDENIQIYKSKDEVECAKEWDKYVVRNDIKGKRLNFPSEFDAQTLDKYFTRTWGKLLDENTYEICTTNGKTCWIHPADYPLIKYHLWYITDGYVTNRELGSMHRFLTKAKDGDHVDHINLNKSDNRRSNLRCGTNEQNLQNTTRKGKFYGVCKDSGKYKAAVATGNSKLAKSFDIEDDAARWRDLLLFSLFDIKPNHFFPFNFSDWTNETKKEWSSKLDYPSENPWNNAETKDIERNVNSGYFFVLWDVAKELWIGRCCHNKKTISFQHRDVEMCARWVDIASHYLLQMPSYKSNVPRPFNYDDWSDEVRDIWQKILCVENPWIDEGKKLIPMRIYHAKRNKDSGFFRVQKHRKAWTSYYGFYGTTYKFYHSDLETCARWVDVMSLHIMESRIFDPSGIPTFDMNFDDWTFDNFAKWKKLLQLDANPFD